MRFGLRYLVTLASIAAALAASCDASASAQPTSQAAVISVGASSYQEVDGFGFSDAFGQANNLEAMPAAVRDAVVNLLFSPRTGAGLDIIRFGLGAAGGPAGQMWLGRQAEQFGVHTFYADAWSAPGELKTNGSVDGGGYLCGSPEESCPGGDFRQTYADWLAAQAAAFAKAGLPLVAVDFVNEPEIGPSYPSMYMTPAQAANFVPYLGRALRSLGLTATVACCDAEGWAGTPSFKGAFAYTQAVLAEPGPARYIGLITGHGYTSAPTFSLTRKRPVWETEWSTFEKWDPAWDDGSDASGLVWANRIYTALTAGDVNAFLYWWGTTTYAENGDNEGLVVLGSPADATAPTYQASGRLWAFAAFSRFVRAGSVRLATASSANGLHAVAFFVPDHSSARAGEVLADQPPRPTPGGGRYVLVAINNASVGTQVQVNLPRRNLSGSAEPYLTNGDHNGTAKSRLPVVGGSFRATVPAGSVETFVVASSSAVSKPGAGREAENAPARNNYHTQPRRLSPNGEALPSP